MLILLVLLSSSFTSGQWTSPVVISTGANSANLNENMGQTIATSGNYVHVVYHDNTSAGVNHIWYRRSNNNGVPGSWDLQIQLSPANPSGAGDVMPLLAVSGANVHVVWGRNMIYSSSPPVLNQGFSIYISSNDNGAHWNAEQNLGSSTFWPGVAASGSYVYVTLNGHDANGHSQVYFRRSSNNGVANSFLAVQTITDGISRCEDPAMSAFGCNVHIVWNDNRQNTSLMGFFYIRSTDAGANWGPETPLSPAVSHTYTPGVFASSLTNLVIAYGNMPLGSQPYEIYTQASSANGNSGSWSTPFDHSPSGDGNEVYPAIVQDGVNNYVHLLWEFNFTSNGNKFFYAVSKDNGISWSTAAVFTPNNVAVTGSQPFLALSGSTVHAIYTSGGQIWYTQNPTANPNGGVAQGGGCPLPSTCSDGVLNGAETDVDCGGGTCPQCAVNKHCSVPSDCQSGNCSSGVCAAPASPPPPNCTDGLQNGLETDVDCGGGQCPACAIGKKCDLPSDCQTQQCVSGVCVQSQNDNNNPAPSSTSLRSSSATSHLCQVIQLIASVTTATATGNVISGGTVSFMEGGSLLGTAPLSAGLAVLSISSLGLGVHEITASWDGLPGSFLSSQSAPFTQTVSGVVRFMTHKRNSADKIISPRTGLLSHSKIRFVTQTNLSIVPALLPDTSAYANAPICSLSPLFNKKLDFLQDRSHGQKFLISPPLTTSLDIYARGWPSGEYQFHQPVTVLSSTGSYQQPNSETLQVHSQFSGILRVPAPVSVVSWLGPRLSGKAHLEFALATITTA